MFSDSDHPSLCYCTDIQGLFQEIGIAYSASDWRLFIDSSKRSFKAVLLHNGNVYPSIPIAHSVQMKERRKFVKILLEFAQYNDHIFQSDHFVLSTNFLFTFNVSLPLVTGELLQNTVDVNNVTYKLYNIKLQRLPVLLNTKNYLSTGQAIT